MLALRSAQSSIVMVPSGRSAMTCSVCRPPSPVSWTRTISKPRSTTVGAIRRSTSAAFPSLVRDGSSGAPAFLSDGSCTITLSPAQPHPTHQQGGIIKKAADGPPQRKRPGQIEYPTETLWHRATLCFLKPQFKHKRRGNPLPDPDCFPVAASASLHLHGARPRAYPLSRSSAESQEGRPAPFLEGLRLIAGLRPTFRSFSPIRRPAGKPFEIRMLQQMTQHPGKIAGIIAGQPEFRPALHHPGEFIEGLLLEKAALVVPRFRPRIWKKQEDPVQRSVTQSR